MHCRVHLPFIATGVLTCFSLCPAARVFAQAAPESTWTGAVDDDWNKAGNWSDGVPGPNDNGFQGTIARVGLGATINTKADTAPFGQLNLRNAGGTMTVSHKMTFKIYTEQPFSFGRNEGASLRVASGGDITVTGEGADVWRQGFGGVSNVTVDGGAIHAPLSGFVLASVGEAAGSTSFNLSAGSVEVGGMTVGNAFAPQAFDGPFRATVNVSGGTFSFGGMQLGAPSAFMDGRRPEGILNLSGGLLQGIRNSPLLLVGASANFAGEALDQGVGVVNMSGGDIRLPNNGKLILGNNGSAEFNMSGGSIEIRGGNVDDPPTEFIVGFGNKVAQQQVSFTQTGGTVLMEGVVSVGARNRQGFVTGIGAYTLSGPDTRLTATSYSPARQGFVVVEAGLFRILNGATVAAEAGFNVKAEGTLSGNGTIDVTGVGAVVSVSGQLTPELGGPLHIAGDLKLSDTAKTVFDFTDPSLAAGTFDVVSNDGTGALVYGGVLELDFSGGPYPQGIAQIFKNWGLYSGRFSRVDVIGLPAGQQATFDSVTGFVFITVPEPAGLAVVGLAALALRRRRPLVANPCRIGT